MTEYANGQIQCEVREHRAFLSLNRPEKKNAINNDMLYGLEAGLADANGNDEVRVIVIRGISDFFSSGRDMTHFNETATLADGNLEESQQAFLRVLGGLSESPKPTVAAVKGFALGGGQATTLACDFVVAEKGTRFGNVEMAYGFPAAMNIVLLARHLGRRVGLEIAMTGETYSAERYYELGLVNRLAEPGEMDTAVDEFTGLLASRVPWAVTRTKATYRVAEDMSMQGGLHLGSQLNQLLMLSSQSTPVHSGDTGSKEALKAGMKGGD